MFKLGEVFSAIHNWSGGYLGLVITPLLSLALLIGLTYQLQSFLIKDQYLMVTAIFLVICVFGITVGLYPSAFSGLFKKGRAIRNESGEGYLGHHPDCGAFTTHVINYNGHSFCSGCAGLIIGSILAIIYTLLSLFFYELFSASSIFWVGVTFTILGIFQHTIDKDSPVIHATLNVLLVIGVAFARTAAHAINGAAIVDFYAIAFSLYIILTRIELSQNDHLMICKACGDPCLHSYSDRRL